MKNKAFILNSLILFCLLIIMFLYNNNLISPDTHNSQANKLNLQTLENNGLLPIKDQSFKVTFKNYPNCYFVSAKIQVDGPFHAKFYLVDDEQNVIYTFPEFYGNSYGHLDNIKAISFIDINNDNLQDIIILAEYLKGIGPQGMIPTPISSIYIQQNNGFISDLKINEMINKQNNSTISDILKILNKKAA